MRHRFLFVNAEGVEVKVSSPEKLVELHGTGELSENTLLYDVVTREWAPARTHPVCRFMLEAAEADAGPVTGAGPDAGAAAGPAPGTEPGPDPAPAADGQSAARPELDAAPGPDPAPPHAEAEPKLELEVEDVEQTPDTSEILGDLQLIEDEDENMVDSFLEAREREREEERMSGSSLEREMELVGPAMDRLGYPLSPVPEVTEARRREQESLQPGEADEAGAGHTPGAPPGSDAPTGERPDEPAPSHREQRTASPRRTAGAARRPPDRRPSSSGFRSAVAGSGGGFLRQAALLVLLVGVGGWGIADAWSAPLPPPLPEELRIPDTPPRPAGPLAAAPVRLVPEDALAQMASSMESLRASMRLGEPPAVWMASPYLANAGAYPEVERYWERYRSFVERLREEEEAFYRAGLEEQLETQGVYGSAQDIRIARVMQNFRGDAPRRAAHYADMDGLADAALELHEFLIRKTANIRYDPVERGLSRDPVLEVDVRDPTTRAELEVRVDRLLEALDAVAGPDPERRRDVTRHVLGQIAIRSAPTLD